MNEGPTLTVVPLAIAAANRLIESWHRHNAPTKLGLLFAVGVHDGTKVVGAAIVSRPSNIHVEDGYTAEVRRLVTDGTPNACSALYGAAARIATDMGYHRIYTYILATEPGTSLKASGWKDDGEVAPGTWDKRWTNLAEPAGPKRRWSRLLRGCAAHPCGAVLKHVGYAEGETWRTHRTKKVAP